jgi:hypothetical protein
MDGPGMHPFSYRCMACGCDVFGGPPIELRGQQK